MSDIEVGEYVRISERCYPCGIAKVVEIGEANIGVRNSNDIYVVYYKPDKIKKHSKNIIDVLEVGDIVNVQHVEHKWEDIFKIFNEASITYIKDRIIEEETKIISILTHEQYKSNAYRLEE